MQTGYPVWGTTSCKHPILIKSHIEAFYLKIHIVIRLYVCLPEQTMWTGLPSSVHSARTNGVDLDNKYPVLPQILQDNGYKTISVGKIHLKAWHMSKERGNKNITEYDPALLPECETVWNENKCNKLPDNYFRIEVTHFLGGHGSYCFGEYVQWLQSVRPDIYEALKTRIPQKKLPAKR